LKIVEKRLLSFITWEKQGVINSTTDSLIPVSVLKET